MFGLVLLALLWEQLIYSDFLKCLWGFPEVFSFASKSILYTRVPGQGYQHDRGVHHERVPEDIGRTVTTTAQNTTLQPRKPPKADQELHRLRILPLQPCFPATGNKNAGNAQQNAIHA